MPASHPPSGQTKIIRRKAAHQGAFSLQTTQNPRPRPHEKSVTSTSRIRDSVPRIESARPRGLEFSQYPSNPLGGPYASLRVLLPEMQEILRQDIVSCGLRRRRGSVPTLRQQECRAALVGLLRHHLQKKRLKTEPRALHHFWAIDPQGDEAYRIFKHPRSLPPPRQRRVPFPL